MEKKKLEQFKKRLETRQQELRRMVTRTEQDGRTADDEATQDIADRAASSYNKEFLFHQSNNDRQLLNMVEAALDRIREGPRRRDVRLLVVRGARRLGRDDGRRPRRGHVTPVVLGREVRALPGRALERRLRALAPDRRRREALAGVHVRGHAERKPAEARRHELPHRARRAGEDDDANVLARLEVRASQHGRNDVFVETKRRARRSGDCLPEEQGQQRGDDREDGHWAPHPVSMPTAVRLASAAAKALGFDFAGTG